MFPHFLLTRGMCYNCAISVIIVIGVIGVVCVSVLLLIVVLFPCCRL